MERRGPEHEARETGASSGAAAAAAAAAGQWVIVNGRRRALPAGGALVALLQTLDVAPDARGVAVAVNDALVPRSGWDGQRLQPGDRVEVVGAVQGG
jgi:sulfur carrier protein